MNVLWGGVTIMLTGLVIAFFRRVSGGKTKGGSAEDTAEEKEVNLPG